MSDTSTHSGQCFCGAVQLEVTGDPVAAGYCHCESCRHWSAGPVNAFTLWKPEQVRIRRGAELVSTFNKTEKSFRKWCTRCGGHLMTDHPGFGLIDVYAAILPAVKFQPGVHVNVQDSVLPLPDGLPHFRDFPKEMGGSGQMMA